MEYQVAHYINGKKCFSEPESRSLDIFNPATGETIGKAHVAKPTLVDYTVKAAQEAFSSWSLTTPSSRAKLLFQYKYLLEENCQALAQLITKEHGKTLAEAESSIRRGIDVLNYACDIPSHLKSVYIDSAATEVDCYSLRQPLGVCAGITPFNFPGMIPLWMFPLAIACGNTYILKPSEKDPSCALRLVELTEKAGFPPGVINLLQGDKETVDALLTHPGIKAVSFVGSTPVAKYVHHTATSAGKRVQAFGGSKNHCIVMPDADIAQVAESITQAAYGCAGERCMAISVAVAVGDKTADALAKQLKSAIAKITVGNGATAGTQMGPLISGEHLEKVKHYVESGLQEGATLIIDGRNKVPTQGFFMGPCLFDHVKPHMKIYQEEIFGPVLCLLRVPDFESALTLINQHQYGNGTAIFTRDGYTARTFASRVQVGMVGINVPVPVPVGFHCFGGWKNSVFSDLSLYGSEGIQFFTQLKTVTARWVKGENWF